MQIALDSEKTVIEPEAEAETESGTGNDTESVKKKERRKNNLVHTATKQNI